MKTVTGPDEATYQKYESGLIMRIKGEQVTRIPIDSPSYGTVNQFFDIPIAKLSNGITVANFSSAHTFVFEDGSELAACDAGRSTEFAVSPQEQSLRVENGCEIVTLKPTMNDACFKELTRVLTNPRFDYLIVSRMMMEAIEGSMLMNHLEIDRCVTIRKRDRNGPICIDKFCGFNIPF